MVGEADHVSIYSARRARNMVCVDILYNSVLSSHLLAQLTENQKITDSWVQSHAVSKHVIMKELNPSYPLVLHEEHLDLFMPLR